MTDEEAQRLRDGLRNLGHRLSELDVRIEDEKGEARRSLAEVFSAFDDLVRLVDPAAVLPEDEDDEVTER